MIDPKLQPRLMPSGALFYAELLRMREAKAPAAVSRRPLHGVLRALGACSEPGDAVPWAEPFGLDWERALVNCPTTEWLLDLVVLLLKRGPYLGRQPMGAAAMAVARGGRQFAFYGRYHPKPILDALEGCLVNGATLDTTALLKSAEAVYEDLLQRVVSEETRGIRATALAYLAAMTAVRVVRADDPLEAVEHLKKCIGDVGVAASLIARTSTPPPHITTAILETLKRELGPALIEGLTVYSRVLP